MEDEGMDFFARKIDAPDESKLASINDMVSRAIELSAHIAQLEEALKQAEKEHRQIVEKDLVERLLAAGTRSFTTDVGLVVTIDKDLRVSELKTPALKAALADRRAAWLEENGGESLIKENVELIFDKGAHQRAVTLMDWLQAKGYDFLHGNNINTGSFKAFVTDIMHEKEVPLEELGLYQKTEAKITFPKERKARR